MRRLPKYNSEESLHLQAADYLRRQYPGVIFRTDFAAGIKMTMGQATKHKALQESKSYPDLFVAEPRKMYHGAYFELKKAGTPLTRPKDGRVILKGDYKIRLKGDWYNLHIEQQHEMMQRLRAKGFYCAFAVGFDQFKLEVDNYLRGVGDVGVF